MRLITKDHINKVSCLGQVSDRQQGSHWCQTKPSCPGHRRTSQWLLCKFRAWKVILLPHVPWWIPMFLWSIFTPPEINTTSTPCLFKHVIKMPRGQVFLLYNSIMPITFCLQFTEIQLSYKSAITTTRLREITQIGQFIKTTDLLRIQGHREIRHVALYHSNRFWYWWTLQWNIKLIHGGEGRIKQGDRLGGGRIIG